MKIGSLLGALLAIILASPSMAACYGRTGAQPQTRFVLRGGEALDSKTDLVWQPLESGHWNSVVECPLCANSGQTESLSHLAVLRDAISDPAHHCAAKFKVSKRSFCASSSWASKLASAT
jgi:hypothetical protein